MTTTFSDFNLPSELTRALDKLGFEEATPVQAQVIPLAMEGKDLLVSAATGSGKTAAFLLPMMQRFVDYPSPNTGTRGLVLVPTRELAQQIYDQFLKLGSYTRLTAGVITGGTPMSHQVATLRKNPDMLIATPGRLLDHLKRGSADLLDLEVLVVDEADRMLDMGFAPDVGTIIGHCSPERQSLLLSATLKRAGLKHITELMLRDPVLVSVDPARSQPREIRQQIILADSPAHKQALLTWLLQNETYDKAVVFSNTRDGAVRLGEALQGDGLRVGVLHGELDQRERNRVIGLLREGRINVLVTTDVVARGIDVPGMQLVINFDVPRSGDDHLHRTGRTGRAGGHGLAVTLVSHTDWNNMSSIERYLRLDFERRVISGLKAKFEGPKRLKGSGKAAGSKAGKKTEARKSPAPKVKERHRDRKNKGKRRVPSAAQTVEGGHTPLRKKGQAV